MLCSLGVGSAGYAYLVAATSHDFCKEQVGLVPTDPGATDYDVRLTAGTIACRYESAGDARTTTVSAFDPIRMLGARW